MGIAGADASEVEVAEHGPDEPKVRVERMKTSLSTRSVRSGRRSPTAMLALWMSAFVLPACGSAADPEDESSAKSDSDSEAK